MFSVYAMAQEGGVHRRRWLARLASRQEAETLARSATQCNARWASVTDEEGRIVIFIAVDGNRYYGAGTVPLERCRPVDPPPG